MNPYSKAKIKEFVIITFMGLFIGFMICPECYFGIGNFAKNWRSLLISLIYTYILGYGCTYISYFICRRFYSMERPTKGFFINFLVLALYSFFASMLIWYFSIKILFNPGFNPTFSDLVSNAQLPMYIALAISMFFSGIEFIKRWKEEAVKAEKLEKEKIATQYESLRNQVNPHFLFNSLNTLSSLVYDNQELAVQYINKLSGIYRYVLDSRNLDLTLLSDEMAFLNDYIFLQKIRFADNLKVNFKLNGEDEQLLVLPLALQIIMENAIKHNEVSSEKPLEVNVFVRNKKLVIQNKKNQKKLFEKGMGIGLTNISERYKMICGHDIEVNDEAECFTVSIPLIEG